MKHIRDCAVVLVVCACASRLEVVEAGEKEDAVHREHLRLLHRLGREAGEERLALDAPRSTTQSHSFTVTQTQMQTPTQTHV
eukprot:5787394-Pleurochrysis_carterae.AAC.6